MMRCAAKTDEFRAQPCRTWSGIWKGWMKKNSSRLQQDALEEILPEAFAAVREASKRTIGQRHFRCPDDRRRCPASRLDCRNAHRRRENAGRHPAHLSQCIAWERYPSDHRQRLPGPPDARWMAPIFHMLGLSIGVLQMAAATENGKKAFIVDFERESPHEDQRHLAPGGSPPGV